MKHIIKINPYAHGAVLNGTKTFEIRNNDRGYQKGDQVTMKCWDNNCYDTSKHDIHAIISYVSTYNQKDGWCVFGLKEVRIS